MNDQQHTSHRIIILLIKVFFSMVRLRNVYLVSKHHIYDRDTLSMGFGKLQDTS